MKFLYNCCEIDTFVKNNKATNCFENFLYYYVKKICAVVYPVFYCLFCCTCGGKQSNRVFKPSQSVL